MDNLSLDDYRNTKIGNWKYLKLNFSSEVPSKLLVAQGVHRTETGCSFRRVKTEDDSHEC